MKKCSKNCQKRYLIAAIFTIIVVCGWYIVPFMIGNNIPGNDIAWEQYVFALVFLLPAIALFLKKPQSLYVYTYPVVLIAVFWLGMLGGDALWAGLLMMFVAIPVGIIYSILVFWKIIK